MLTAGLRGDGRIVAEAVWGGATGEDNHGDAAGQWHRAESPRHRRLGEEEAKGNYQRTERPPPPHRA